MESASGLDVWTFAVAMVSAILALLALLVTVWFGRRQIRLAEEQLTLARKEAENRPVLAVSAMDLTNPADVDAVVECAQERKERFDTLKEYEDARRASEEASRRSGMSMFGGYVQSIDPGIRTSWNNPLLMAQQDYDGPFPDWVLRIIVVNKGKTAALDLSGQLYLDPSHLEPLDFPGLDGNIEVQQDGTHQVSVYTADGSRLLPAPKEEELTFDVAVLVKQPGTTNVRYAFATPLGDHVEDTWSLDVPPPT